MPMEMLTRSASVRERVRRWRHLGHKVALIPTAGTLHKGHERLIAAARTHSVRVIVSTFAPAAGRESLTQTADRELLRKAGADIMFVPPIHEIFPYGLENGPIVDVPHLANVLEGSKRPGHFVGLTTVFAKLANIVRPDLVVLGERDYQWLVMVRQLIDDLFLPLELVSCPVARDYDGLVFASTNRLLTLAQRTTALRLHATLRNVAKRMDAGERDYNALEQQGFEALASAGLQPEYLGIRQSSDLAPARADSRDLIVLAAATIGSCRLVDNLRVRFHDRT